MRGAVEEARIMGVPPGAPHGMGPFRGPVHGPSKSGGAEGARRGRVRLGNGWGVGDAVVRPFLHPYWDGEGGRGGSFRPVPQPFQVLPVSGVPEGRESLPLGSSVHPG